MFFLVENYICQNYYFYLEGSFTIMKLQIKIFIYQHFVLIFYSNVSSDHGRYITTVFIISMRSILAQEP